jgi:hypothetical protein
VGFFNATTGAYMSRLALDGPMFPRDNWLPTDVAWAGGEFGGLMALRVSGAPLEIRWI